MNGILGISLSQLAIMFCFMLVGFILAKLGKLPENTPTVIGKLVYWVFLPALSFNTMVSNVSIEKIGSQFNFFLAGIATVVFGLTLAYLLRKRFGSDRLAQAIFMYSIAFSNYGYLGYPMISGIYGQELLCSMMIMCIPYNFVVYAWGAPILSGKKFNGVRDAFTPALIAMLLGIIAGLLNISMPSFSQSILSSAGNCMAPCGMVLAGCVLARSRFKELFGHKEVYVATALRLVIIPAFFLIVMRLLRLDINLIRSVVLTSALPFGLNTIVFPEANGKHSPLGASCCIVATVFAIITVPIVCMFIEKVY